MYANYVATLIFHQVVTTIHESKHNHIFGIMRISKMLVCIDVYVNVFGDIPDYNVPR